MSFARRDPQEIEDLVKRAHERGLREGEIKALVKAARTAPSRAVMLWILKRAERLKARKP